MSESQYPNEALEPLRESLGFGISAVPCSESGSSLETKTLREFLEQMQSDSWVYVLRDKINQLFNIQPD
ncbi:unnamed protein product [Allacma fusca]|uniref:Uncharacterized protein n=1 Tax=Allacma fusca TaxID=39272 RepID=A0A8J2NV24_9HEXA|nr:unnamed protein product [Allacma fusca]